jgi:hypothetical protein
MIAIVIYFLPLASTIVFIGFPDGVGIPGRLRGSEKTAVGNRGPAAFEEAKASAAFPELLRKAKGLRGEFRGCRRRRR